MKRYEDLNHGLKSLDQKMKLTQLEQLEVLSEINKKMNLPRKKQVPFQWKYYIASAVAVLLIAIVALPILNHNVQNLVGGNGSEGPQGSPLDNQPTNEKVEEEIKISIVNQTDFNIYHTYIKIFQNGIMKQSQGGMNADNSAIKRGDGMNFTFFDYELGEGTYEVELGIAVTEGSMESEYLTGRVVLEINDQHNYTLELKGEAFSNLYLENLMLEGKE